MRQTLVLALLSLLRGWSIECGLSCQENTYQLWHQSAFYARFLLAGDCSEDMLQDGNNHMARAPGAENFRFLARDGQANASYSGTEMFLQPCGMHHNRGLQAQAPVSHRSVGTACVVLHFATGIEMMWTILTHLP